jgi:hypothetical protein
LETRNWKVCLTPGSPGPRCSACFPISAFQRFSISAFLVLAVSQISAFQLFSISAFKIFPRPHSLLNIQGEYFVPFCGY